MLFKRSVQRYGTTPEPETPYQRAGQLWDQRIGTARLQARNWRLMAFGGLVLTAGMSASLVWQSLQSRIVPYVVEVDRLGEPRAVTPAEREFEPTDAQVAWHLARFVEQIRTVSLDPVLMRRDWLSAYDLATERGGRFLSEYARSARPFDGIGERTVSVQVTSVVRASDRSFQVKWTETVYEGSAKTSTSRWTTILAVVRRKPKTVDVLRRNPLGIYVDAIDWSRELEPVAPVPATPRPMTGDDLPAGSPLAPASAGDPIQPSAPETKP